MLLQKTLVVVSFVCCIYFLPYAEPPQASEPYNESYVLTISSCHYLEDVQRFTSHEFLVCISSECLSQDTGFTFTGRYNLSSHVFPLSTPANRTIVLTFDVFELFENNTIPCDIQKDPGVGSATVVFDTFTGQWTGDDACGDDSGYGRLNGCDDASYNSFEQDFELCFSIDVVDPDGDGIPQWTEEQLYGTDPTVNDADRDDDADQVPLSWEWRYGYDPFTFDDHTTLDPDQDGLNNYEEYRVSLWDSDPYRKDIYLELDQMQPAPGTPGFFVPLSTTVQVYQTFAQRNIVFHVDSGCMGGGEILPYDSVVWIGEERRYYHQYFLHDDPGNWRRGVFRYALYVHDHRPIKGMEFPGENPLTRFFKPGLNSYVIATQFFQDYTFTQHACIMLHELGHTLGIYMGNPPGCDNQLMRIPFSLQHLLFRNYRSVMNYDYTYKILDYSDGSHGFGDYDDWGNIDLTFFQPDGAE